jgi:hypothetical protein
MCSVVLDIKVLLYLSSLWSSHVICKLGFLELEMERMNLLTSAYV